MATEQAGDFLLMTEEQGWQSFSTWRTYTTAICVFYSTTWLTNTLFYGMAAAFGSGALFSIVGRNSQRQRHTMKIWTILKYVEPIRTSKLWKEFQEGSSDWWNIAFYQWKVHVFNIPLSSCNYGKESIFSITKWLYAYWNLPFKSTYVLHYPPVHSELWISPLFQGLSYLITLKDLELLHKFPVSGALVSFI